MVNDWAGLFKEALSTWRTYLDKKAELYSLHLRKRRENAIKIANQMDDVVEEMFHFIEDDVGIDDKNMKKYRKLKRKYEKLDIRFDKLS